MSSQSAQSRSRSAVVCRVDDADCDDLDLKLSKSWLRIAIAAVFAGQGMVLSLALNMTPPDYGTTSYWVLHGGLIFSSALVIAFLGGPLIAATFGMVRSRRLSIEGLFTLSLGGAYAGSVYGSITGDGSVYYEIVAIVIAIYTFGRMLGARSQEKVMLEADKVREKLDYATRAKEDGSFERVEVRTLGIGDSVRIDPGEAFTVDGIIREGMGYVSETALTGEPSPVVRRQGDRVRASTYSVDGSFIVEALEAYGNREIDQILRTVEDPGGRPSELQNQANRLTQVFLPIVAGVSILTAIFWWFFVGWHTAFLNSMTVLLIACPCALGLATPVAIWHGLYRLYGRGLLSRDGALIDALGQTKRIFFDKTGTLSENAMEVVECYIPGDLLGEKSILLSVARGIEEGVAHPAGLGIVKFATDHDVAPAVVHHRRFCAGEGIEADVEIAGQNIRFHLGSFGFDTKGLQKAESDLLSASGKRVCLFWDERLAAVFVLREKLRVAVDDLAANLKKLGIECEVLTGDPRPDPNFQIPVNLQVSCGLSAQEKLDRVRESQDADEFPIFVGDGVNDTAAMAAASASVSMESGVPLARSTASARFLRDRLEVLAEAIEIARAIRWKLRGNLAYAAAYNVVGMAFASAGFLHPIMAALIMLVSSFLVTARVLRD